MLWRMSRVRATALVLFAALAWVSGCGGSESPQFPAGDAGSYGAPFGGEAGAGDVPLSSGGSGARGESGADAGGEGGAGDGARPSNGGSGGRKPHTVTGSGGKGGGTATSGGSGGGDSSAGGSEAGASSGGSSGSGGGAQGGNVGVAGSAGTAASAGAGGQSNQLSICVRLSNTTSLSGTVTNDFQNAVVADCNINWVFYLYYDPAHDIDHLQDFMNQVFHFNLGLWGCSDGAPPTSFELLYGSEPLTSADAGALIDAYMSAADADLSLSPPERDAMRAILERLSDPLLVTSEPGAFSHSRCGAGGTGGTGGQGGLGGQTSTGGLGGADSTAAGQGGAGQGDTGGAGSG